MLLANRAEADLRAAGWRRVRDAKEGRTLSELGLQLLLVVPQHARSSTVAFQLAYDVWPVLVFGPAEELAEALGLIRGKPRGERWTSRGVLLVSAQDRGEDFVRAALAAAQLHGDAEGSLRDMLRSAP